MINIRRSKTSFHAQGGLPDLTWFKSKSLQHHTSGRPAPTVQLNQVKIRAQRTRLWLTPEGWSLP